MTNAEEAGMGETAPLGGDIIAREEIDRSTLLAMLSEILKNQHRQALGGRVRDERKYKLRLDAVRVYGYLASVYGSILRDRDLSDIIKRLEVLENAAKP
jgi:hypothetical protein